MPEPNYIYEADNPTMPRRLVVGVQDGLVFYRVERMRNRHMRWGLPARHCGLDVWDEWVSSKKPQRWELRDAIAGVSAASD